MMSKYYASKRKSCPCVEAILPVRLSKGMNNVRTEARELPGYHIT